MNLIRINPNFGREHLEALLTEDLPSPLDWLLRHPRRSVFVADGAELAKVYPFVEVVEDFDPTKLWAPHVDGLLCGVDVNVYSLQGPPDDAPPGPNGIPGEGTVTSESWELVGRAARLHAGVSKQMQVSWQAERARRIEVYAWGPCVITDASVIDVRPGKGGAPASLGWVSVVENNERKTLDVPVMHGCQAVRVTVRCL